MIIRHFFLLFFSSSLVFLSFVSNCSATFTCKKGTNCSFNGTSSGNLGIDNFTNVKEIQTLDLSQQNITFIDQNFWSKDWESLTHLNLSLNKINENLPEVIGNLTSLVSLNLSMNSFFGEVPIDGLNKLVNLTELDLSVNRFNWNISLLNGTVSHQNLRFLSLAGNLVRQNFFSIGNFSRLEHLNLSSTGLQGPIPENISGLVSLRYLDLSNDNLTGPIISNLSKIKSLEYLNLSGVNLDSENNLSSIGNLRNLSRLDLSKTKLTVEIPTTIKELKNLIELDLSDNKLTKGLSHLDNLTKLKKLNLSFNNLDKQIPQFIPTVYLMVLDLSHNKLTGPIPNFAMANLTVLDLSSNNLTGLVPDFGNISNLTVLDLSHNKLTGGIPNFAMANLTVLDLSNNHLSGQIPDFSNMTDLMELDLSNNNLSGSISEAMEKKMQSMRIANISNNWNFTSCSTNTSFWSLNGITKNSSCEQIIPKSSKSETNIALAVVLPIFFLIVIFAFLVFAYRRRRKLWTPKQLRHTGDCSSQEGPYKFQTEAKEWVVDVKLPTTVPVIIFDRPLTKITFADLLVATSNFSRQSLLVEESSGPVYAGCLPEGHPVSIKVLVNGLSLSDQEVADELERLAQIKHQNLVQLMGYCFAGRQRIVIYDYMQNGTLQDLLHKVPDYREDGENFPLEDEKYEVEEMANDGQVHNTWEFRHKIALGVARGLAFLHHGCSPSIIHGFIGTNSILLDSNLEPRLSDYTLYRLTSIKFQDDNPYGSPGYMAEATAETDVYDFGVLLFELLTGKQASDGENPRLAADSNLVNWIRGLSKKDMLSEAIDVKIRGTGPEKQMGEALRIGYLCTADIPSKRPSMKQVIGLLKDIEPDVENTGK